MNNLLTYRFIIFILLFSCNKSENPVEPSPESTTEIITAAAGGIITTQNNISVEIPPGALSEDTEITLSPITKTLLGEFGKIGVRLEPDGLSFSKPVKVNFPLPADWPDGKDPVIYEISGEDPTSFYTNGFYAELQGSEGVYQAVTEISHFSSLAVAENCHAGTIKRLLLNYESRGCTPEDVLAKVKEFHPSADFPDIENINDPAKEFFVFDESVQYFLDTYFTEEAGFEEGEDINIGTTSAILNRLSNGYDVVVGFNKRTFQTSETNGIYKRFAHSAILEYKNGELKLRQSVAGSDKIRQKIKDKHNGENVFWYPKEGSLSTTPGELATELNNFRKSKSGTSIEQELCGSPGCLENNPDISFPALSLRQANWTAIKFYISKSNKNENPCTQFPAQPDPERQYLCWINVQVRGHLDKVYESNPTDVTQTSYAVSWGSHSPVGKITNGSDGNWNFSDEWNTQTGDYDYNSGTVDITFNERMDKIISLELRGEFAYSTAYNNPFPNIFRYELSCSDIPIGPWAEVFIPYIGRIEGTQICGKIQKLEYYHEYVSINRETLISYECNSSSYIDVRFF